MKKRVFKRVSKIVGFVLVQMLLLHSVAIEAHAAEAAATDGGEAVQLEAVVLENTEKAEPGINARALLYNCVITVFCSEDGLLVEMTTDCTQEASAIGVKDVSIEKKVWYGWKEVAVSSGAEISDSTTFGCSLLYTDAEYDATYRICCTHYADADEYVEVVNRTDGFVFTY